MSPDTDPIIPTPAPPAPATPGGGLSAILAAVAGKITWERALLTVLALLAGALLHGYRQPPAATPVNLTVTTPAAADQTVFGAEARRDRDSIAHTHFAKIARHKLSEELQRNGLKGVGGNAKPIDQKTADKVAELLKDDAIHAVGQEHAPEFYRIVGDGGGGVLNAIISGMRWLIQHPDIWVPILLKLLVLVAPLLA